MGKRTIGRRQRTYPVRQWAQRRNPSAFGRALREAMDAHKDTLGALHSAINADGADLSRKTVRRWVEGKDGPRSRENLALLEKIDARYGLDRGYLRNLLLRENSLFTKALREANYYNERLIRWHVPADFDERPRREQEEILLWIRDNVLSGGTDFGRYVRWTKLYSFWMRFPGVLDPDRRHAGSGVTTKKRRYHPGTIEFYAIDAPSRLLREMEDFIGFKTAPLSPPGYRRWRRWSKTTAEIRGRFLKVLFGALSAPPSSPVKGFGLSPDRFTFGLLAVPATWDWFLAWQQDRRGFLTRWEREGLLELMALVRRNTGWIRQHPELAKNLRPVAGLISAVEIKGARTNWDAFCDTAHAYARDKAREIRHLASLHRDPFEPILSVLTNPSPLSEYRKIADEILLRMPDKKEYPVPAANLVKAYLMFRLAMHLGARQRNLRELLICPRGSAPKTERQLQSRRLGEMRWNDGANGWEIFIPAASFKNSTSSFFDGGPFQLVLPDLAGLYSHIEEYLSVHRPFLLGGGHDPGTFCIRRYREGMPSRGLDVAEFYELWKFIIQTYGIKNPYTGRGAVAGLLPHGPNSVRDVLATHVLKRTGSYALAAYAIHDTPLTVMKHYGRFLPQEKLAQVAEVLNEVWEAEPGAEGAAQGPPGIGLKGALSRLPAISSHGWGYSGGIGHVPPSKRPGPPLA